MSDYIRKRAVLDFLKEEIKKDRPDVFKIYNTKRYIEDMQTLDEKEIIRKTVERIVERLEEEQSRWKYDLNVPISRTINKAIEIVKEEGGIDG